MYDTYDSIQVSTNKNVAFWTNTSFFKIITMVMSYMFSEPKFNEDSKKIVKNPKLPSKIGLAIFCVFFLYILCNFLFPK